MSTTLIPYMLIRWIWSWGNWTLETISNDRINVETLVAWYIVFAQFSHCYCVFLLENAENLRFSPSPHSITTVWFWCTKRFSCVCVCVAVCFVPKMRSVWEWKKKEKTGLSSRMLVINSILWKFLSIAHPIKNNLMNVYNLSLEWPFSNLEKHCCWSIVGTL